MKPTRLKIAIACMLVFSTGPVFTQDNARSLADIRTELEYLSSQIESLRGEMLQSGAASADTTGGTTLMRIDAMEGELRTLTGQVEQLQYRIDQIVKDATNRVGDIEFRLTELEGGDVTQLGESRPLGGEVKAADTSANTVPEGVSLTVTERADFEAGLASLNAQEFAVAADQFTDFIETYPGGPLTALAQFHKGEALAGSENWKSAGRSFLNSFSSSPNGETAPRSLYWLGFSLSKLGKTSEACKTLAEVPTRYGENEFSTLAKEQIQTLGCS